MPSSDADKAVSRLGPLGEAAITLILLQVYSERGILCLKTDFRGYSHNFIMLNGDTDDARYSFPTPLLMEHAQLTLQLMGRTISLTSEKQHDKPLPLHQLHL